MDRAVSQLTRTATKDARGALVNIRVFSDQLARMMSEIHGGSYRVHIDHEDEVIVIARRREKAMCRPKHGEAV